MKPRVKAVKQTQAQLRATRQAEVSKKVREASLRVNCEFAAIEYAAQRGHRP
jgi:hypothetical protein